MSTATEQKVIRVGHSPDPDDAFMFHALANDKIPTGNLKFVHELQDIETLNRRALNGELEVTAVSILTGDDVAGPGTFEASFRVEFVNGAALEPRCDGGRPTLTFGTEVALPLTGSESRLEAWLPDNVAPRGSRAAWTGEALLVAVPLSGEVHLRRYECVDGVFSRTDVR